mgnify:FL=1
MATVLVRKTPGVSVEHLGPHGAKRGVQVGLLNCRAEPTTEIVPSPTDVDQQPYIVGDWVVVHNGTIANDKELLAKHSLTSPTRIDSWVIAGMLDKLTPRFADTAEDYDEDYVPDGILYQVFESVIKELVGSFAIIAHCRYGSDALFYATNYRPLYYKRTIAHGATLSAVRGEGFTLVRPYSWGTIDTYGNITERGLLLPEVREKQRSLVVLSGGLDSTTVATMLKRAGHDVECLHFTYGCRAQERELEAVSNIAAALDCRLHVIDMTDLFKAVGHSRLTVTKPNDVIDNGEAGAEQAIEWVPARNTIMSSVAIGIAEGHGFDNIALGINLEESGGGYTDNVLDLYEGFNGLMQWIVGVNKQVKFTSPVGHLMKHEIVREGVAAGAPLELTWSCYNPGEKHCGNCGPCTMRRRAFERNGLRDPVFE